MSSFFKKILIVIFLICSGNLHSQTQDSIYIFSYFKGNGEAGLHLASSLNGKDWKALNNDNSFISPQLGEEKLMRDPCIIQGKEGLFHMVWTVGWTEKGIGYASSKNLKDWSVQKLIPVMQEETLARNCWAPEITYDPESENYIIYWATTITGKFPESQIELDKGYNHRIYYTLTKDFENFTPSKLLFEPGFNVIDATIQKIKDSYLMIYKNETRKPIAKNLNIVIAKNLTGPYQPIGNPITGNYWAEGPSLFKVKDKWIIVFDKYIEKEFGAIQSKDLQNWKDISEEISFPEGARHGSVLKVSIEIFEALKTN